MRLLTLAAALVVLSPVIARAQTISSFKTGNDLHAQCGDGSTDNLTEVLDYASCRGYIMGALDTYAAYRGENGMTACYQVGVTGTQVFDMVIAYLRDHPGERHQPANYLVNKAVVGLFVECPTNALNRQN